ncbi:MAG: UpxY family transcription antiterminator [Desulfosarcina sp.]|nr:UpxY family transcription antiterminator [Desulfobacterales bacterium]
MKVSELQWQWYVLHTRSRFEKVVHEGLHKKSHEVFLPQIRVRSRRRDRRVMLDVPLFPGYVFVRSNLHPDHHLDILKTVGAVRLIGNKDVPVPVLDETVDSLKIIVSRESSIKTGSRLRKGDRVIVVQGPFTGVVGTFVRYRGIGRMVVHIEALGQYASVEVGEEDIEALRVDDGK